MPVPLDLRKPLSDQAKQLLGEALAAIPEGKRAALIVIADQDEARVHVASRLNGHWKVAATAGKPWNGPIRGTVAVEGSW